MNKNGPSCFACSGNESPFHAVLTDLAEIYCDNCADICPMCEGETWQDCGTCSDSPGLVLTHYGRVQSERRDASYRQDHADTLRGAGEER